MKLIKDTEFGGERPLFESHDLRLENVVIRAGESAIKECSNIEAFECRFEGNYPFWHVHGFKIDRCYFDVGGRSALWYCDHLKMTDTVIDAPKMFREMNEIDIENVTMNDADEVFWRCNGIRIKNLKLHGGWIRNLVEDSGFKGKVTVVGVDKDNIDKEMKELGVKFITKQTILKKRGQQYGLENELIDKCWTGKRPVYISVDKDVLDEKEYKTNWNQGIMSVDELFAIIEDTFEMRKVIGMDICGEMDEAVNSEFGSIYNEINQAVNMRFLKFRIS